MAKEKILAMVLAGGQNPGVAPLCRVLELPLALLPFSFFRYRFEDKTVCGTAGAFCRPGDALLKILRQANSGRGHW